MFGGALDFNDCDSIDIDHFGSLRNATYRTGANDGEGWEAWQAKMASLTKVPHMWGFNKDEEPSEPWLGQVRHG